MWGLGGAGLAAVIAALVLVFTGGGGPSGPHAPTQGSPPRTPFAFSSAKVRVTGLSGTPSAALAAGVAEQVR
ncbi:MAG TPA: hypothetical protein VF972_12040, partial [Actinomycetota bacterium]